MPLATPDDATTFCTGAVTSTSCVRRSVFTLNVCMGCSRYLVATASLPESDLLVLRKMNDEVTPDFPARRKSGVTSSFIFRRTNRSDSGKDAVATRYREHPMQTLSDSRYCS